MKKIYISPTVRVVFIKRFNLLNASPLRMRMDETVVIEDEEEVF